MQKKNRSYRSLLLVSSTYILIMVLVLSVSVYAWFTFTNINRANLISQVSGVEAEYQFYVYQNGLHEGSTADEVTLVDNVCNTGEDMCYAYIPNPTSAHLIDGKVAPGERFSFAIQITSVGTTQGKLMLELGGLQSIGYDLDINKIQTAFMYEVTKISYLNMGVETEDQKDNGVTVYHSEHFEADNQIVYPVVSEVYMNQESEHNSVVVVYFDIYFDPLIYGETSEGIPYTNSNIFMSQIFSINHIYMTVYS